VLRPQALLPRQMAVGQLSAMTEWAATLFVLVFFFLHLSGFFQLVNSDVPTHVRESSQPLFKCFAQPNSWNNDLVPRPALASTLSQTLRPTRPVNKFAVVLGAPGTGKTAAMATAAAPLVERHP